MTSVPKHSIVEKKRLGAFYTPSQVSNILCDWAIRSSTDKILEPSFGGCGFLEASSERLKKLGCSNPNSQLFGCDIDKTAFHHLANKVGPANILGHFILSDFLKIYPDNFSAGPFEVIIGNPPYISHHNMTKAQKEFAYSAMESGGFSVSAKASLWAYFVLHSLRFLKKGGRMAWVMPSSFLYADYSQNIRSLFTQVFKRVFVISLGERVFIAEGADEHSILVLCEGYELGAATDGLEISYASNYIELEENINEWHSGLNIITTFDRRFGLSMMDPELLKAYSFLVSSQHCVKFGEIAKVLIGIVTGDNKYFILNAEDAQKHKLTQPSLTPILAKFNMSRGLLLDKSDLLGSVNNNIRCLLVDTTRMRKTSRTLQQYLDTYSQERIISNKTFKKRVLWHRPNDGRIPDAFLPYMHHLGPRLVLNDAKITSTNTIHRVFFKDIPAHKKRLASISLLTTFSQLSAEIEGRCYGSGVLKHEPREASSILLIMPNDAVVQEIDEIYYKIDNLLRSNQPDEARSLADLFVLKSHIESYGVTLIDMLNNALEDLRSKRHKKRADKND